MIQELVHGIITFIDLTALTALIGAMWCRLLMVELSCQGTVCPAVFFHRLRRLLMICMVAIVISSIANLAQRTVEMSGSGVAEMLPLLPTVIFKTHYGSMWLLRMGALTVAWAVWWVGQRHMDSRFIAALMLFAGAAIAFSRSASGHAADFGDLSPQQLADWIHIMIAASWGGALIALASIIPSSIRTDDSVLQQFIAVIADRFYAFFGPALAVLVLTGLYSAWFEIGSFQALVSTPYGGLFSAKLVLFLFLTLRYIAPPEHGKDIAAFVTKFYRRTRVEAVMVLWVLLSVSLLTHGVPARHSHHVTSNQGHSMDHGHSMEKAK
jgi:putative copper resistance protein D